MRRATAVVALAGLAALGFAQGEPDPVEQPVEPRDLTEALLLEVDELHRVAEVLRLELAQSRIEAANLGREIEELRQFIRDHEAYGRDFEQYQAVKDAAQRAAQRREQEAALAEREIRRAERVARQEEARLRKEQQDAELARVRGYRDAGFTPLGFDVYLGRTAFYYHTDDEIRARVDWEPGFGRYIRLGYPGMRIDYSSMTISGSVLNTAERVRNIGVAVTFFDENGAQVGAEIIQVNNARPDVPYPFTATIEMALDRPFASSSSYVLYADEAG